jgi:hypothetical protein
MNQDRMPSYRGTMLLDVSSQDTRHYCWWGDNAGAFACSAATPATPESGGLAAFPETIIDSYMPAQDSFATSAWELRDTLFYEQAHIVDFNYLTDTKRARLLTFWGLTSTPVSDWWKGDANVYTNSPPGEMFAEGYRACAEGLKLANEPEAIYQLAHETQGQLDQFCAIVRADLA